MISKPVVLVILDGWGVTAPTVGNAITSANTKYWDYLLQNYPTGLLQASGSAVGLPWGKMGNSEVGHLTIGAGNIFLQSLENINQQITAGDFFKNEVFLKTLQHVKDNNSNLHLFSLLGDGGIHGHQSHLLALMDLINQQNLDKQTFLHLFLDGRDTAKDSGLGFMEELISNSSKLGCCQIATVSGRYFAMDRNKNWDRIQKTFLAMLGQGKITSQDILATIKSSYDNGVFDEEFEPIMMTKDGNPVVKVSDNDAIIFLNFRADRARQLTEVFVSENFGEFDRGDKFKNLFFTGFVNYKKELPIEVVFPKPKIDYPLARIISDSGLKQLHIAETEKYAHVTFFINGLKEDPFKDEDRILIPSPAVSNYADQPEMSAYKIKDKVLEALDKNEHDFILINFANPDMVGHTGILQAGVKAVEVASECLGEISEKVLAKGGQLLVTADHGNIEEMINLETQAIDKEHSNFPVPFVLINNLYKNKMVAQSNNSLYNLKIQGALIDVAPTVLGMLGLEKHQSMLGIDLGKSF